MKLLKHLLAVAAALAALQAQAMSVMVSAGPVSTEAGAVTIDFDSAPPANWCYTGGGLFAGTSGVAAQPPGSTGNFWSVGISSGQNVPGLVTIAGGAKYYGFLWGSPDSYNAVSFYDGANLLAAFDGSVILNPPNGNQSVGKFLNAYVGAGETITSVRFMSTNNAFETDNHAVVAVPEPETYALMLVGLAAVGATVRRRRSA